MSSTESSSNKPNAPRTQSGPAWRSVTLVAATLGLLGALVWALNPSRPDFTPAPLHSLPPGCATRFQEFTPSNVTEVPDLPMDALTPAPRNRALLRMNMEPCPCGCNLSIAACRVSNPTCEISKKLAAKIVREEQGETNQSSPQ